MEDILFYFCVADNSMKVHNKKSLLEIRRNLRALMTPAEEILWNELRNGRLNGLKFKRQHSIRKYVVDFYCYKRRLIIELDGGVHLEKEQMEKDKDRDAALKSMYYTILRIKNENVYNRLPEVLELIKSTSVPKSIY